jgi:hypothetical protein
MDPDTFKSGLSEARNLHCSPETAVDTAGSPFLITKYRDHKNL